MAGKNQVCPKAAYIFVSIPNTKGEREFGVFISVNQHVTHSKEKRGLSDEAREVVYDLTKQSKKPKEIANILKSKNIEFCNIDQIKTYRKVIQARLATLNTPPELLATSSEPTHQESIPVSSQTEEITVGG